MPTPSMHHSSSSHHHHHHHRVQPDLSIPINIASQKVEKEYDDSVLQRRLKNIESFLQSKIKWVLNDFKREDASKPTGKNGKDDVDDDDLLNPPATTKRRKDKHSTPSRYDDDIKSKVSYSSYQCYTMLCWNLHMSVAISICLLESVYVCWNRYMSVGISIFDLRAYELYVTNTSVIYFYYVD